MTKKILIIEQKEIHFTTCEPIILYFLKKNYKVLFVSTNNLKSYFENIFFVENDLTKKRMNFNFKKILDFNFIDFIKYNPDISIISDRYFYHKPDKKLKLIPLINYFFKFLAIAINKYILIKILKRKYFIITTHFINGDQMIRTLDKLYGQSFTINFLFKRNWNNAMKYCDGINVYSSLIKDRIRDRVNKKIFVAPNAYFKKNILLKNDSNNKLLVIIPGRIDTRRREYDWIDNIPNNLSNKIEIVFLGKARTEEDMNYVSKLNDKGFIQIVKSVGQLIEHKIFDNYINSADILFVPLRELNHEFRKFDRNLGPYFDSIRFGKPLIIPSSSPCPPEIKKSTIQYDNNDELYRIFSKLTNKSLLNEHVSKAFENSSNWSLDRISYFNELINHYNNKKENYEKL